MTTGMRYVSGTKTPSNSAWLCWKMHKTMNGRFRNEKEMFEMIFKVLKQLCWLVVVLVLSGSILYAQDPPDSSAVAITETSQAIAKAKAIVGFDFHERADAPVAATTSGVETIVDTTTPFVRDKIHGRRVWRVDLRGLVIGEKVSEENLKQLVTRDFTVYLDSASGMLLQAISRAPHYDRSAIRRCSAEWAEKRISCTKEPYVGLPVVEPTISIKDAIALSFVSPWLAMEISVRYVVMSIPFGPHLGDHNAWVIEMSGGFTIRGSRGPRPGEIDNHLRLVVDAESGKVLTADIQPTPPLDESVPD